jgi:phosphatidylglycerol:prolipoprotein diacylglycerol transferase
VIPVLFRIGPFEVTSFGVMVAVGALAGLWILGRELRARNVPPEAADAAVVGLVAGLVGAKLLWVAEHLGEDQVHRLLFARGGLSWYGGPLLGAAVGLLYARAQGWPLLTLLGAATPALAVGQMLGRVGCFLVGDDYGRPTTFPWGVRFPRGLPPTFVPVHPTQLYEAAMLGLVAWLLVRWSRQGIPDRELVGRYLAMTGGLRFLIELLRTNEHHAFGLTLAQWIALPALLVGLTLTFLVARRPLRPS